MHERRRGHLPDLFELLIQRSETTQDSRGDRATDSDSEHVKILGTRSSTLRAYAFFEFCVKTGSPEGRERREHFSQAIETPADFHPFDAS